MKLTRNLFEKVSVARLKLPWLLTRSQGQLNNSRLGRRPKTCMKVTGITHSLLKITATLRFKFWCFPNYKSLWKGKEEEDEEKKIKGLNLEEHSQSTRIINFLKRKSIQGIVIPLSQTHKSGPCPLPAPLSLFVSACSEWLTHLTSGPLLR